MIRLIQRRLIIPRGDTGRFSLPKLITNNTGDAAIFSILDPKTHKKVFEKRAEVSDNSILIEFNHGDTVNLPVGKYVWDIKFYCDPVFVNDKIVDGQEIDSYYAAFTLPVCEIRQTGDNLLMADDTPNSKLTPESINYLTEAMANVNNIRNQTAQYASNANNSAQNSAADAALAAASAEAAAASAGLAQSSADKITGLVIQSTTLPSNSQATTNYDAENGILTIGIPHGNGIASTVFNNNYTLTITLDDGTTFTTPSLRGQQGEQGLPFFFETTYSNIDDMYANMYIDNIPEGRYVIIQSNVENVNNGKVYQRHGDTYDFIVDLSGNRGPRGIGIISIEKTGTSGLTDTYTITYSDDSTSTFTVNNGATGATGAIPEFSIGSVTEGFIADASISGTASHPVLNLVLPQATVPSEISSFTNDVGYLTDFDLAKGEPYGVASLDSSGKVPSNQLPSYVDDVLEFPSLSDFPETGETGKIYVALDTNLSYRWGGSSYVVIASSLALGETSETAYRGDRGKIAYDHAQAKGNAYANGLYKITTNEEGHVTAAIKVTKEDFQLNGLGADYEPALKKYNTNTTQGSIELVDAAYAPMSLKIVLPLVRLKNTNNEEGFLYNFYHYTDIDVFLSYPNDDSGELIQYHIPDDITNVYGGILEIQTDGTARLTSQFKLIDNNEWYEVQYGNYQYPYPGRKVYRTDSFNIVYSTINPEKYISWNVIENLSDDYLAYTIITLAQRYAQIRIPEDFDLSQLQVMYMSTSPDIIDLTSSANPSGPIYTRHDHVILEANGTFAIDNDSDWDYFNDITITEYTQSIDGYVKYDNGVFYGLATAAGMSYNDVNNQNEGTYSTEAKAAIQNLIGISTIIGNDESDITADKAYSIGEVFLIDGTLYRATSYIAQNGIITPGVNCEATSITQELSDSMIVAGTGSASIKKKVGNNVASGGSAEAFGQTTIARGIRSVTDGLETYAFAADSKATGYRSASIGAYSHADSAGHIGWNGGSGIQLNSVSGQNLQYQYPLHMDSTINSCGVGGLIIANDASAIITNIDNSTRKITVDKTLGNLSYTPAYFTNSYTYGYGAYTNGYGTVAMGGYSYALGILNTVDNYNTWPQWVANTSYEIGDKVQYNGMGYTCKKAGAYSTFSTYEWVLASEMNYVEMIGNGSMTTHIRSNARTLDWDGNERLMGDLYVRCNSDSSGGTLVATIEDMDKAVDTKAPVIYYTVLGNSYTDTISIEDAAVDMPFKSIIIPIKYSAESINSRYTITGVDSINLNLTEMPSDKSAAPRTDQYTVNFANTEAGTVYGGYYDIISGELTVTHKMLDLGSIVYNQFTIDGTNKHGYYSQALYDKKKYVPGGDEIDETFDTERYPNVSENEVKTGNRLRCIAGGANYYIYIYDDDYATSTTAEFKEGISGTKFVYELQTPVKYQLTSQEIRTLGARNYLYTDTYTPLASVTYPIDTKSYIDWKITDLTDEIPNVPVQDVQVNGTSVLNSGVANIPVASTSASGVVQIQPSNGVSISSGKLYVYKANSDNIKAGTEQYKPLVPYNQHESTFYGLAKAAGHDEANSQESLGTYTQGAKAAIQHMLGIDDLIGTVESNYTASKAYAIGDIFIMDGTLYRATAAMAIGDTITPDTNCEAIDIASEFAVKKDTVLDTTLSIGRQQDSAVGLNSVAIGSNVVASGNYSQAFGTVALALGTSSTAHGSAVLASGSCSHAEGATIVASGTGAHAEGYGATTKIKLTGAENVTTYTYDNNLTEDDVGYYLYNNYNNNYIISKIIAVDETNHTVTLETSFGEALNNVTTRMMAGLASGKSSHMEGGTSLASGDYSHAEGYLTKATAARAHAEGLYSSATGLIAHAEGQNTVASGGASHAEGTTSTASGSYAHAENNMTVASGIASHSEGCITLANGRNMHASGQANVAAIIYEEWVASTSYNENDIVSYNGAGYICTTANSDAEWTSTNWRALPSNTNIAFVVGNGTADNARSNAYALTWTGDGRYAGDIYVGCNNDSTGGTKLAKLTDLPEYATDLETQAIINEWEVVV